jgi:hypothetical protein
MRHNDNLFASLVKPYNLTYFITFFAIATFASHKIILFNRKPYKMFYTGMFYKETYK